MPITALIDERIMCMHGGISRQMNQIDDIVKVIKPTDVPDAGMIADLLWNDPDENIDDWDHNERGCGEIFGAR